MVKPTKCRGGRDHGSEEIPSDGCDRHHGRLLERGHAVRALAHREDDRSKRLEKMGAEVVIGDFLKFNDVRAAVERQLNAPIS